MTDPAIIASSYAAERNYSHNLDDVIDASDAVGAWGTAKESTTKLSDLSGNGNIADIYGAMPAEGFIQGRRYDGNNDYLDCDNVPISTDITDLKVVAIVKTSNGDGHLVDKTSFSAKKGYALHISSNKLKFTSADGVIFDGISSDFVINDGAIHLVSCVYQNGNLSFRKDGIENIKTANTILIKNGSKYLEIGAHYSTTDALDGIIYLSIVEQSNYSMNDEILFFNTLARLTFWSVNYTDYPDNVTEYTDNLPYSSSVISSGTFKVDSDKLQCVSAGTMTYSASYEFDGSEYIKVEIDGVEYAGTGTITQGNTTVSVAQGSNKITIAMGTADTIDEINIQFRDEV